MFLICSKILIARFAPSIGSVPEPSSSSNIKDSDVKFFNISTIFVIWDENVLSELLISWSSPISVNILSKTYIEELSSQGIARPEHAIQVKSPTVFNVTVFPPVFGPVINNVEKSFPKVSVIGTMVSLLIKGCLAFLNVISFLFETLGIIASIVFAYFAFANIKSSFPIISKFSFIWDIIGTNNLVSSDNIFSISMFSSFTNSCISLFISKTDNGSINTVEPAFETSWINPFIDERYSSFTGITKRSLRIVIIGSWIYLLYEEECIILFNLFLISCSKFFFLFLIEYNSFDALSSIRFSSSMQENILEVIELFE